MNILISGGLGYIGSHTIIELIKNSHTVIIADNLINSKMEVLDDIFTITTTKIDYYKIDVTDESEVESIFNNHKIDGVIHFSGLKAVGESVSKPFEYYYNNLVSTMLLSKMCLKYGVNKFVFSSSVTVYSEQLSQFREDMELKKTINPYGETKAMSERILTDIAHANEKFAVSLLQYFSPLGAHESGLIGEDPNGVSNNPMPFITKIAKGHVKAIENLHSGVKIYNLGTGKGTSVLELVNTFIRVDDINISYEIVGKGLGDIAISFADINKAEKELGWKAELTVKNMVRDAWKYESGIEKGGDENATI